MTTRDWRQWVPELALVGAVLLVGLIEIGDLHDLAYQRMGTTVFGFLVALSLVAAAVALVRKAPGWSLAIACLVAIYQLVDAVPFLGFELALVSVLFGCARWGRPTIVVLSGLTIFAAAVGAALLVSAGDYGVLASLPYVSELASRAGTFAGTLALGGLLGTFALASPWLLGLALRATDRAHRSETSQAAAVTDAEAARREATQAQEVARLRDDQARLARDVHDVVGHSLAVVLAQAESGQYLPDDDPARLKQTLATIATSARQSLQDVRQVLGQTSDAPTRGLDSLVEGVRASGLEVVSHEEGTPRPLPPDLEVVAHRVLQEMLTNAVKHGRRDRPVRIERLWPDGAPTGELRIEVRNDVDSDTTSDTTSDTAQGVDGMRRRLEATGGRLDLRRREGPDGSTFTATAWVPVRTVAR